MVQRIEPQPGQESVWDYPRPPRVEGSEKRIRVVFNGRTIADSQRTVRILETSHPPVYYIPLDDVRQEFLVPVQRATFCEWKGVAQYFDLVVGDRRVSHAVWRYPQPTERFAAISDCVAVYPSQMEACYVDDELVQAQAGDFYGGWITSDIVGPFKGGAGTWGW
ncbi:DUF427 domain-containing protein [Leptolyngbya iicbica]|uniref:DUF427 domain-containing protein n=2 Tax=Cyanophyceae TaxID=3028117 RepID=A0A4Q7E6Q1_9CYAN|nr:DUF427 domain-containing protein [Leptolyngbya sp. LK]RZM76090.1 DUF427 domain-containing protein [Leptolyngbya sp. LK]